MNESGIHFPLAKSALIGLFLYLGASFSSVALASDPPLELARDADLYLVPIGYVPAEALREWARRYSELARLKVEVVGQLPLPDNVVDTVRKQLIAERAVDLMARTLTYERRKPWALVIGVTPHDMYIAGSDWHYAYAYGQGKFALVSAARMADAESNDQHWSARVSMRVQKMLDKRIALQMFGLGNSAALPAVLATPVLGLDDLDRLDAQALSQALSAASQEYAKPAISVGTAAASAPPTEPPTPWAILIASALVVISAIWLLLWFGKKSETTELEAWKAYAERHGWRFSKQAGKWLTSTPFEITGEHNDTAFLVRWSQTGLGKNAQYTTHLWWDIKLDTPVRIGPRGIFSWLFKRDRIRTGNRHYDCRFLVQTRDINWKPTPEMQSRHLAMPVNLVADKSGLNLIHSGRADEQELERLFELANTWRRRQIAQAGASMERLVSPLDAVSCWLGKAATVVFWSSVAISMLVLYLIPGEETNLPWELAWQGLMPVGVVAWLLWVLKRLMQRRGIRLVQELLAPVMIGVFLWGLSGVWLIAWNAVSGEDANTLAMGSITQMREIGGKGGPSYFVKFRDINEQRLVEIRVDSKTYSGLRIGDPVGFDLRMGGLGMYYFPSPVLTIVRSNLFSEHLE